MIACHDKEKLIAFCAQDAVKYRHFAHDLAPPCPPWDEAMAGDAPHSAASYFVDNLKNISLVAQTTPDKLLLAGETTESTAKDLHTWCRQIAPKGVATTDRPIRYLLSDALGITEWGEHASYTVELSALRNKSSQSIKRLNIEDKPLWQRFIDRRIADDSMKTESVVRSAARDFNFMLSDLPVDCYAVVQDNEIAGVLTVNPFTSQCAEISTLYVEPQHRRKGFASSLLTSACKDIFARNKKPAYFAGGNPPSLQRMLAGLGFEFSSYFWEWRFWW